MPRRKESERAVEMFHGAGVSSELELELAPEADSGYAGVSRTTSGKWRAVIRVERRGEMVKRNVGSYETPHEAAIQRALALRLGAVLVLDQHVVRDARAAVGVSRGVDRFTRCELRE